MRVRLAKGVRMAGPAGSFGEGEIVDVDTTTAGILIANGSATPVDAPEVTTDVVETATPPVEYATATIPATATAKPQRKRKN